MSKQKRKFNRSQAAHRRLAKKHHAAATAAKKRGEYRTYDIHSRKARYHNEAEFTQRRLGRILTPEEKTNVFNKVVQIIGKFFRGISTPKRKTKKKREAPDYGNYQRIMREDFPKDFVDEDPFTAALLDSMDNKQGSLWN